MGGFLKRVVLGILGVALTLGYWTVKGWFTDEAGATVSHIPEKVWDGGGGTVFIEVETTDTARVSATFEANAPTDEENEYLESWERVQPGRYTYKIEVPASVSGTAEVCADEPKVGSRARIAVQVDGSTTTENSATLTEPLKPGYAFCAQIYLEDYATGAPGVD